jgi:hypothetical protein
MENFKKTFSSNGYPKALIDSWIKTFLDRIYNTKIRSLHAARKLLTSAFLLHIMADRSVHNLVKFFLLLTRIFPYVLYSVPLVVFLVSFRLKTKFPLPLDHMLCIYQFTCRCSPLYVGQIRRHIHTCTYLRAYGSLAFDYKRTLYLNHVWYTSSLTNTCTCTICLIMTRRYTIRKCYSLLKIILRCC